MGGDESDLHRSIGVARLHRRGFGCVWRAWFAVATRVASGRGSRIVPSAYRCSLSSHFSPRARARRVARSSRRGHLGRGGRLVVRGGGRAFQWQPLPHDDHGADQARRDHPLGRLAPPGRLGCRRGRGLAVRLWELVGLPLLLRLLRLLSPNLLLELPHDFRGKLWLLLGSGRCHRHRRWRRSGRFRRLERTRVGLQSVG